MRPVLALLLVLLAGLAACRDRAGEGGAAAGSADPAAQPPPPSLTPAESARAVRRVQRHAERTRRRAEAEATRAGLPRQGPPPPAPPAVKGYAECMARVARAPSQEERAVVQQSCRNLPGAP